jgi:hypothetical protein
MSIVYVYVDVFCGRGDGGLCMRELEREREKKRVLVCCILCKREGA